MEKLNELLKKYGNVEQCEIIHDRLHVKVTTGFSGGATETFDLIKQVSDQTENKFPLIDKVITDKDMFHLILKK